MFRMCHQCLYYSAVVDVFAYVSVIKREAVVASHSKRQIICSCIYFFVIFFIEFFLGLGLYQS